MNTLNTRREALTCGCVTPDATCSTLVLPEFVVSPCSPEQVEAEGTGNQVSRALREQPRLLAVTVEGADMPERTCSIDDCERPLFARGWCSMHYGRWYRHGDPQGDVPRYGNHRGRTDGEFVPRSDLEARFWAKVDSSDPLGCWPWTASLDTAGYGRFQIKRKTGYAHRVSYELSMGHIGQGLEIDHLCRNRSCVNPLHLQAVPAAVNMQRVPKNSKTHCPQGHPLSGDNLRVSNGRRLCRTCGIERSRAWREAKKSA